MITIRESSHDLPPKGAQIVVRMLPKPFDLGVTRTWLWVLTAYQLQREAPPKLVYTSYSLCPVSLAHEVRKDQMAYGWVIGEAPRPSAEDCTKLGIPLVRSLVELLGESISDEPQNLFQFAGALHRNIFADMQRSAQAPGSMADWLLERLPEHLKVGPDASGQVRAACGAVLTPSGPVLADPCIAGGPCRLTKSGRCWRMKGSEPADRKSVEVINPPATVMLEVKPAAKPVRKRRAKLAPVDMRAPGATESAVGTMQTPRPGVAGR